MELFDTGRKEKPEPPKVPTAPQMRFLHVLSSATFTIRNAAWTVQEWKHQDGTPLIHHFSPAVARNVIRHGWAAMKSFRGTEAVYALSREGREAIKEFCPHPHLVIAETSEVLAGKLICKQCARVIRCRSKQPTQHGANIWNGRYGPMCNKCVEYLKSRVK